MNKNSKTYYIYGHKNKLNSKWYIGQTCQQPYRRWRDGKGYTTCNKSKGCRKFANAIKKYGWDNFEHIILETTTEEFVDEREIYYINKYNSIENGYNLRTGGNHHLASQETKELFSKIRLGDKNPFWGKHHSEESKRKMSISQKNRENLNEIRLKLSKSHKGKMLSSEHKQKIRDSCIGINTKKILCIEDNIIFDSLKDAVKYYNLRDSSHISHCFNGSRKTCGGLHWKLI